jgi:predicted nucleic acid-binding protein
MILVDSNIPMYLVGAPHPHKTDAQRILERLTTLRERLVTDAEVFQEILHRYTAIARPEAIQPTFDALRNVVDDVIPIAEADVFRAKDMLATHRALTARDAIHAAVMANHRIKRILSFDRGFDAVNAIDRISSAA